MDPNEALRVIRESIKKAQEVSGDLYIAEALYPIIDAFASLDDWLKRGGFPPKDWPRPTHCASCGKKPT